METFILQLFSVSQGTWVNYVDMNGFNVEFVSKEGARAVAFDSNRLHRMANMPEDRWRIVSSKGTKIPA